MLNFLRRTRLYQQVTEVISEYRALKRAEHRAALRLKRAAVKARIKYEVQRAQLERVVVHLGAARTVARVQAARAAAMSKATEKSVQSPESNESRIPNMVSEEEYKKHTLRAVEEIMPGDGPGREIASKILRQSVKGVELKGADRAEMGLRLVAGVAKQADVGWKEMEQLVEMIEKDEPSRTELKQAVRKAMEEEEKRAAA